MERLPELRDGASAAPPGVMPRFLGWYATSIAITLGELRRRRRGVARRLRGRANPLREAKLPVVSWRECTPAAAVRIVESGFVSGNVTLAELGVLCAFAADCESGSQLFEIGTFDGRTTLNLRVNAPMGCTVSTLDLPKDQRPALQLAVSERKYVDKDRSGSRFAAYVDEKRPSAGGIDQHYGDSAVFDFSPYHGSCGLVFVDGSHAYDYVISDSRAAFEMARPGGVILWHDYGVWQGVTRGLNDLDAEFRYGLRRIRGTSLVYWRRPVVRS